MDSRLPTLFGEVADLTPAERVVYFHSHDTPSDLASEIESLLHFDQDNPGHFTGIMAANLERLDPARLDPAQPGDACGPYRLVRLLGQGGMGSVYLAERTDGEIDLRAAIKFVRGAGAFAFYRRFFRERQILAGLNHPGIARLLDAGHTAAGQPYLVMEHVDGLAIDQFAASLRLRDKLLLFLKVCDAVSYLHHNLIIHRDLKPSNILVESSGDPQAVSWARTADAVEPFQKAFDAVYQASLRDPLDASVRDRVATAGASLADALRPADPTAALLVYDRTLTQLRQGREQSARLAESRILSHSSYALRALKRSPEAKQRIDAAFALLRAMPDYQERIGLMGGEWDDATRAQADLDLELHRPEAAHATLLDCYQKLLEKKPNPETDLFHATVLSRLYLAMEHVDLALKLTDETTRFHDLRLALWRAWDRKLPNNWYVHQRLQETPP